MAYDTALIFSQQCTKYPSQCPPAPRAGRRAATQTKRIGSIRGNRNHIDTVVGLYIRKISKYKQCKERKDDEGTLYYLFDTVIEVTTTTAVYDTNTV